MNRLFHQYYQPTTEEFTGLWRDCFFAFDANVLLNLYRYSETTTEALLLLFERLSERIAIPYQFALEFHENRLLVISEQTKNYTDALSALRRFHDDFLQSKRKHPFLSKPSITALGRIQKELSGNQKKLEALFTEDPYLNRITQFIRTVGDPPAGINELHDQIRERYTKKIPPGFKDLNKGEPRCFGDCVGWFQLIDLCVKLEKPLIFISDDTKEDWWQIQSGRTLGPLAQLKKEFFEKTGKMLHMYASDQFMSYANTYLESNITESAIKEVAEHLSEAISIKPQEAPKITTEKDIDSSQKPSSLDDFFEDTDLLIEKSAGHENDPSNDFKQEKP